MPTSTDLAAALDRLTLVDHHVHSTWARPAARHDIDDLIRESGRPLAPGLDAFDSALGLAIRRHCAPLIGLPAHAVAAEYLEAREFIEARELSRLMLNATGVKTWLIDTGHQGELLFPLSEFETLAPGHSHEIVRLETLLETAARSGSATTVWPRLLEAMDAARVEAVGWKSIVAYRHGFRFDPARPTDHDIAAAVERWLQDGDPGRVDDPVLLRALLWAATDTGMPIQIHTGFGDGDLTLNDADPILLTDWLRLVEGRSGPIVLLHTYPFQRQAAYLAHVYPHVYFDVGLGMHYSGAGAAGILREAMEIAPFGKLLYSSDGWGLPELHYLGFRCWIDALKRVLIDHVDREEWHYNDALRIADMIGSGNARRIYGLR